MSEQEHICANCKKTIGKDCNRKRRVIEGYCTDCELKASVGVEST